MKLTDVDKICDKCPYKGETSVCSGCRIGNAPEVDAVPVVRCKYCKHCVWLYQKDWPGSDVYLVCTLHAKMAGFDGYCFWGERDGVKGDTDGTD